MVYKINKLPQKCYKKKKRPIILIIERDNLFGGICGTRTHKPLSIRT